MMPSATTASLAPTLLATFTVCALLAPGSVDDARAQAAPAAPAETGFIRVDSCQAVNFYGGLVNQYAHQGQPVFDLRQVAGCTIDGWILVRSSGDQSPFIALGPGLDNLQARNVQFQSNVAAIGVSGAPGAANQAGNLVLENLAPGAQPVNQPVNAAHLEARNVRGEVGAPQDTTGPDGMGGQRTPWNVAAGHGWRLRALGSGQGRDETRQRG